MTSASKWSRIQIITYIKMEDKPSKGHLMTRMNLP